MKSILLAVGCDRYDELEALSGAEADATKVFTALTSAGQPYSAESSRLLLSPSKQELERVLLELGMGSIDVLTFYFAGHGGTKDGAYYFALRDSRPSLLSLSGYALNGWLNLVRELKPRYAYLIIDSCQSGGSHHDIRDVLNDPRLGQHSATTFACLAAAASNQYAGESGGAGLMTTELLKVLNGSLPAGTDQQELDLTDIARVVGTQFEHLAAAQRPVAWGLNLFGPGRLCRNPRYAQSGSAFHIPEVPPGSMLSDRIAANSDGLWELYRDAAYGIDWAKARKLVLRVSDDPSISPEDRSAFIFGLAQGVAGRLENRGTPWEATEALGGFAAMLLRDVGDPAAARTARTLIERKLARELELIPLTLAGMGGTPPSLLNSRSPMGDFYYLPLRLLKLLATVAQAAALGADFGLSPDTATAHQLVQSILADYSPALRAVADEQAPSFFVWSHFARRLGWRDELELVFGCLFSDLVGIRGRIARCDLPPDLACEYIFARGTEPVAFTQGWLANPSQFLGAVLLVASENSYAEQVDPFLADLDHERLNIYLPMDYRFFADEVMEGGVNRTHVVGTDIWNVADFSRLFGQDWQLHVAGADFPRNLLEQVLVSCASLIFPDRLPLSVIASPP